MTQKKKIIIGIAVLILLSLYFLFNPSLGDLFPKCPFYSSTGAYCPGCGSQRAIHDLVHLRILDALSHNFLMVLLLPTGLILYFFSRKKFNDIMYHPKSPYIIFGIIGLYWILRNLDFAPFHYLAP
ncbi:MAG: DUF2752 domain-containing protein [Flavobacteriaceae bacterium]